MNMYDEQMIKGIREIEKLHGIKYVAMHVKEDTDGIEYDRTWLVAEDRDGNKAEIHFVPGAAFMGSNSESAYRLEQIAEVLTCLLIQKVFDERGRDFTRVFDKYMESGNINDIIASGRELAPYGKEKCLNKMEVLLFGCGAEKIY